MNLADAIAGSDQKAVIDLMRQSLLQNGGNIPPDLKKYKAWLVWKAELDLKRPGKIKKIPVYPTSGRNRSGTQGGEADLASLGTFDEAWGRFEADASLAGVGFATLPQFGVVAVDVDRCVTAGEIPAEIENLLSDSYVEKSPSGTGLRAFYQGRARDGKCHEKGFEIFHAKGFVTVTGNAIFEDGPVATLTTEKRAEFERRSVASGAPAPSPPPHAAPVPDLRALNSESDLPAPRIDDLKAALACLPADDRDRWVGVAHQLKSTIKFGLGGHLWLLFDEWSSKSEKYDPQDAKRVWESCAGDRTSYEALYADARRHGWAGPSAASNDPRHPPASDPVALDWSALPLEPPELEWLIPGWLPAGVVTLFSARGGTGKSYLSIYIGLCLAVGRDPFREGQAIERRRVVIYSAEDSRKVVEGRLILYMRMLGVRKTQLENHLLILDATKAENVLYTGDQKIGGRTTPRFDWLKNVARDFSAELLIFDNASDGFDANENDRSKVRQFLTALPHLAPTVLLLAHVDAASSMADSADAKGYSGSTAWHNSARSRWYMARSKDSADVVLKQPKVNYAVAGSEVIIRWNPDYRVFAVASIHEGGPQLVDHRPLLLALLARALDDGETVSPATNSPNSVYNRVKDYPEFPSRLKSKDVSTEVSTWRSLKLVQVDPRQRPNRTMAECLSLTEKGRALANTGAGLSPPTMAAGSGDWDAIRALASARSTLGKTEPLPSTPAEA